MKPYFYKSISFMVVVCAMVSIITTGLFAGGYPKIANLWGWWEEDRNYDLWAKYDMVIMSGGSHDALREFRREVKKRNPDALFIGSSPFQNIWPPDKAPWIKDEWYLRKPNGEKINWWVGQLYSPNLFKEGYLDAAVNEADNGYGQLFRDGVIDGFMFDSVVGNASWYGEIDTDLDGIADKPEDVDQRWQKQQNLFFDKLRERFPKALIIANDVDMRHAPHLNGRLFEGSRLLDLLPGKYIAPQEAIHTLNDWMNGSRQPGITYAIMSHPVGWQWWRLEKTGKADALTTQGEIDRVKRDYPRMRLGLMTTLMTNAYYVYDFGTTWYGYPMWYAEYDAPLGNPLGEYKEVFDKPKVKTLEWNSGSKTDSFILNKYTSALPEGLVWKIDNTATEWNRVLATDPSKVHLKAGRMYRITADCEVITKPKNFFQCVVRTSKGGWEHHDKGNRTFIGEPGEKWHIETTVKLDDYDDYALEWHQLGGGALKVTNIKIEQAGSSYLIREFDNGSVLLNPGDTAMTVKLDQPLKRIKDDAAPKFIIEMDDSSADFTTGEGWQTVKKDGYHYGEGYRSTDNKSTACKWSLTAPGSDVYTIFACIPKGEGFTNKAAYSIAGNKQLASADIDQTSGDAGWVRLFDAKLKKGKKYEVTVRNSGKGIAAADAIRAESKTRYNDGSIVKSIRLEPMDGIILLKDIDAK